MFSTCCADPASFASPLGALPDPSSSPGDGAVVLDSPVSLGLRAADSSSEILSDDNDGGDDMVDLVEG